MPTTTAPPPRRAPQSGDQYVLRAGADVVEIAGVGASLRRFRHDGRDLVVAFDAEEVRPAYRGALLAPWPNRIVDGRYVFAGEEHRLALSEPDRRHALHGLVTWSEFEATEVAADRVTLGTTIPAQAGYPWWLRLSTTFRLDADGLTQTVEATNLSATAAPFGTAPHPYLVAGSGTVDDWTLELPVGQVLLTDERLSPAGLADVTVDPTRFDFRTPRAIGRTEIDHAFTDLARTDGRAAVRLTAADGSGVSMIWDDSCPWVQIHTADLTPGAPGHRGGLAVEPMTCAPDAFNADPGGDSGLLVIGPGQTATARWTIRALDA